ncbi:MAG TPA: CARDB domain-containing protein, partial [Nitriliruptorales bacterium]
MQSKLRRTRAIVLTFAMLATMVTAMPALAHGEHDQGTAAPGDPCSAAEFPGSKLITLSESRQSFIPSRGGVTSVDVCIENLVGLIGTDFTLRIYEGGTASNPGPQISSVAHDTNGNILSAQWVHVDLGTTVDTTPGSPYVIGLDPALGLLSSVTFQWRATCNDGLLTSCDGVPDAYPDGNTNDLPGNADYAFRTNPLHTADLVGDVEMDPALACPSGPVPAAGTVTNTGLTSVAPFEVEWWLSADPTLSGDDIFLGTRSVGVLGAGASVVVGAPDSLPDDKGPDALALGEYTLLLHVDSNGDVVESGEGNNVAGQLIEVVECGQPDFVNLSIGVDEDQVQTGIHELQFADLDWPGLAQGFWQSDQDALESPVISGSQFSGSQFSGSGFSGSQFSGSGFSGSGFSGSHFSG